MANPYEPPKALVDREPDVPPGRPYVVIVTYTFAFIALAVLGVALITGILALFDPQRTKPEAGAFAAAVGMRLAAAVFIVLAIKFMRDRSRVGQMLGAAMIVLVSLPALYATIAIFPRGNTSTPQLIGSSVVTLVIWALVAYWFYAFALSRRTRNYFSRTSNGSSGASGA